MSETTPSPYPECEKLAAAGDRWAVADFLEWCSQRGYHLAEHVDGRNYPVVISKTHEAVILEYLEVDPEALDLERRSILTDLATL